MRPLVFLHGGSHGSWCWEPLFDELRKEPDAGSLLALDMPGAGRKRGRDVSEATLASIAAELNQDIAEAGLSDVILVGHSIAGVLLPMMAAADPGLFSQLVFLATSLPREGESINEMMGKALHGEDPDHVGWPADPATTPFPELMKLMFEPDLSAEQVGWLMGEVAQDVTPPAVAKQGVSRTGYDGRVPATYVVTLRDPILPPAWQRRFAERALCTALVEIDTPHEPFVSHPRLLAQTLREIAAAAS